MHVVLMNIYINFLFVLKYIAFKKIYLFNDSKMSEVVKINEIFLHLHDRILIIFKVCFFILS